MSLIGRIASNPRRFVHQALTDPKSVAFECNRQYHRFRSGYRFDPEGFKLFDEDWDNCIVLDACRHDYFEDSTPFDTPVETRRSPASATKQFVRRNFQGDLTDTVYVSANWWYWHVAGSLDCDFHASIRLDHDQGSTTDPETVVDAAIDAAEEYPNKRLLVHFMQPHRPYLGVGIDFDYSGRNVRETVNFSGISDEELEAAYRDNLNIVLEHVEELVEVLDGRTAITADHGELLGDRTRPVPVKWYGHPHSVYVPELTTVPWQAVENGTRRETVPDAPVSDTDGSIDVTSNLRSLGYLS